LRENFSDPEDAVEWPRISIVTPTYNSVHYLEQTIRSVIEQGYPNLEHIVVDGGSTDGTLDILSAHPHVRWISEPDSGQADALNKGFRIATGDLVAWLNSDDAYLPNALKSVAQAFLRLPEADLIHGDVSYVDVSGAEVYRNSGREFRLADALLSNSVNQQAAFFRRHLLARYGYLRTDLNYVMDYEFWIRLGSHVQTLYVPETWAIYRLVPGSKTVEHPERFWIESLGVFEELFRRDDLELSVRSVEQRAFGRMHWLAGTGLYRVGERDTGRTHCLDALRTYDLLGTDYGFAVGGCRYIEGHQFRRPKSLDWMQSLMADLRAAGVAHARFFSEARGMFYATRAYYCAHRLDRSGTRRDTLRAITYDPNRWLRNRGFLRQGIRAFAGEQ
jgi:glycosyltransferase involved in cell wall biosynthesis